MGTQYKHNESLKAHRKEINTAIFAVSNTATQLRILGYDQIAESLKQHQQRHDGVVSMQPSETMRGRAWLTNFARAERPTARLLLDSLQVGTPTRLHHGLRSRIEALKPLLQEHTGVLIPVRSIEDIDAAAEEVTTDTDRVREMAQTRHVAYDTFHPGASIPATPGSEAAIGSLIRDLTGHRPGREPGQWLHPATDIDALRDRRCRLIVLITDYTGSGKQVNRFAATFPRNRRIRSWRSFGWLRIVVVAYAASTAARAVIEAGPATDNLYVHTPAASFDDAIWTPEERDAIEILCMQYAPRRKRREALGHDGSRGLFFTSTRVPNNLPSILRRGGRGWKTFLAGRNVPADLVTELGDYQAPTRALARIAQEANQARLGRAIESGRLSTPADRLVAVLALVANSPQTSATLAHRLALPDDETEWMLNFLKRVGFIGEQWAITSRGRAELGHARRLERIATARLIGNADPYYPQALR